MPAGLIIKGLAKGAKYLLKKKGKRSAKKGVRGTGGKAHMKRVEKRGGAKKRTTVQTHKASVARGKSGKLKRIEPRQKAAGAKMYKAGKKKARVKTAVRTGAGVGALEGVSYGYGKAKEAGERAKASRKTAAAKKTAPKYQKLKTVKPAKPTRTVKTKGGDYPVYKKGSEKAKSFRSAFSSARKGGKKTFTWEGRKYTTKVK